MTLQKTNNSSIKTFKKGSVQISLNGLSFLFLPLNGDTPHCFYEEFEASQSPEGILLLIQNTFKKHHINANSVEEITIIYATPLYTLVPEALFVEEKKSEYLKFNSKILKNDFIAHDTIKNQEIKTVYIPYININNYFFETFGSFSYYHSITLLLGNLLMNNTSPKKQVYIHILAKSYDVIVIANGKLELCNTFTYKTPQDFIYYILFVFEQLNLSIENTNTKLLGTISLESPLYKIAFQYIREVTILEENKTKGISIKQFLHQQVS